MSRPLRPLPKIPHDCESCGMSDDDCLSLVRNRGRGCCTPCYLRDTHGDLLPRGEAAPDDEKAEPWHEAGAEADYRWHLFIAAKDPLSQAMALTDLANAMHDLRTYLPGYEFETGTLPWQREDVA